ncbi:MAG: hypothetical protein A3G27_08965 [Betaproteobacteria bacterium RIFCSPLOWO2_12_FULL_66_14]|nr:MAG: hypothetical protein A3G27_08965 [Betaproteobacteria bacterium RIFCSPLOWO2_12_FULL_66_14]
MKKSCSAKSVRFSFYRPFHSLRCGFRRRGRTAGDDVRGEHASSGITWYYPDGTVRYEFRDDTAGIDPLSGSYMDPLSDASSFEEEPLVPSGWRVAGADAFDDFHIIE